MKIERRVVFLRALVKLNIGTQVRVLLDSGHRVFRLTRRSPSLRGHVGDISSRGFTDSYFQCDQRRYGRRQTMAELAS